jgi:circadian clock protein KaiC
VEASYTEPPAVDENRGAASTGIDGLDRMIAGGGLPASSCTALVGPPGSGKTVISMQFLNHCGPQEPGLFFGFYESPARLLANARSLGLGLSERVADGSLQFAWYPVGENVLDELGHALIEAVQVRGIKRLVVDGLAGFFSAATHPERMERFLACLSNELRRLGATTVCTFETRDITGIAASPQLSAVSGLFDNEIYVRTVETGNLPSRRLSIMKMRGQGFDPGARVFRIGASGVVLEEESCRAPGTAAGAARRSRADGGPK